MHLYSVMVKRSLMGKRLQSNINKQSVLWLQINSWHSAAPIATVYTQSILNGIQELN